MPADQEQGGSLFEVPEEALFIRVPRARLIAIASAFLVCVIIVGVLTGTPLGGAMGLMLLFTGPIAVLVVYFLVMFAHVWKAYKYSVPLYITVYALAFIISVIAPMIGYYTK